MSGRREMPAGRGRARPRPAPASRLPQANMCSPLPNSGEGPGVRAAAPPPRHPGWSPAESWGGRATTGVAPTRASRCSEGTILGRRVAGRRPSATDEPGVRPAESSSQPPQGALSLLPAALAAGQRAPGRLLGSRIAAPCPHPGAPHGGPAAGCLSGGVLRGGLSRGGAPSYRRARLLAGGEVWGPAGRGLLPQPCDRARGGGTPAQG